MRVAIHFAVALLVTFSFFVSTKSFGQCASSLTLSADPVLPAGGYAPNTTVTFTLNIGQFMQVGSNWLHGVTIDFGEGWDSTSFVVVQPAYTCSGAGYWDFYETVHAEGSGLTLGPGFFFDFDNQFVSADGNPGNNYGDENALGFCNWNFVWQITTDSTSFNTQPNGSIVVYGDGTSGIWNNALCGGDFHDINGLVENSGCNASFAVTGSAFANWPLTFEQTPFSVDWDSMRWWIGDSTYNINEITQTFDTPGLHSVCLAVYDSACADTICADVYVQPNPFPFNASAKVFGFLFYDSNLNGTKEVNEPGVQIPLRLDTTSLFAYPTSDNGRFTFYAKPGILNILPYDTNIFHITTQPFNPVLFVAGVNFLGEVGIVADTAFAAAEVLNGHIDFKCDSVSTFRFGVHNKSSNVLNGDIKFLFKHNESILSITSADTLATFSNDTLIIPVNDLKPFAYKPIQISFNISMNDGDSIQWEFHSMLSDGSVAIVEEKSFVKTVNCSNDLVEKIVTPQNATPENFTLRNTPLTYSINFHHNSVDSIQRITVMDTLSIHLNESSLFVADAPYPYEAMTEGNVLKVVLPEIYLYELNDGYVTYNINHDDGIPHNTAIYNTAYVSIDGSEPLQTNESIVTIVDSLVSTVIDFSSSNNISLQPNPADNFIELQTTKSVNGLVEIHDAVGKLLISQTLQSTFNKTRLNISALPAGIYTCRITIDSQSQRLQFVKQ